MRESETAKPKWVQDYESELMKEGLKAQAAARFLIRRLGFRILKAEQDTPAQKDLGILENRVGNHLARYSDYIVRRGRQIFVIEVKAKQVTPYLLHSENVLMFNTSIFLKRAYVDTIARVLVLAVLYPQGIFGSSRMSGKKVYYALLGGKGSRTAEGGVEISLDEDPRSYRWVRANIFRRWIKSTNKDAQILIQMHPQPGGQRSRTNDRGSSKVWVEADAVRRARSTGG
jgi:hypothetical protein